MLIVKLLIWNNEESESLPELTLLFQTMTPHHNNNDSTGTPCNLPIINPETTTLVFVPDSPTTSSHSHHVSFLSWLSGRGSTSGQTNSKNYSANFCRICHEGESAGEKLISPCRCYGSVRLMHRSCVEKWLSSTNHDTCEICKHKYFISRHPRPFSSWLCEPVVGDDQRKLVGDSICLLLLLPSQLISASLEPYFTLRLVFSLRLSLKYI